MGTRVPGEVFVRSAGRAEHSEFVEVEIVVCATWSLLAEKQIIFPELVMSANVARGSCCSFFWCGAF